MTYHISANGEALLGQGDPEGGAVGSRHEVQGPGTLETVHLSSQQHVQPVSHVLRARPGHVQPGHLLQVGRLDVLGRHSLEEREGLLSLWCFGRARVCCWNWVREGRLLLVTCMCAVLRVRVQSHGALQAVPVFKSVMERNMWIGATGILRCLCVFVRL